MLKLIIPGTETYDEIANEFHTTPDTVLELEHSLVSLSKWESKWRKAFLSKNEKTREETLDYIRCMTLTKNVDPIVYYAITPTQLNEILEYIDNPMTATYIHEISKQNSSRDTVTSELIYYWMVSLQIPFECQKWHLNRLITLIKVCNLKNDPKKNIPIGDIMARNRELNAQRRAMFNSKG